MLTYNPNAPPAFHLLAKPTGATCNLDCHYCFFLSKEMLYPGSRFRMADELLELYIKQLIEAHQIPQVTIAWQGGEPTLMGLDFFRRSIEYEKKYAPPGTEILNTIQTNGTLIDDEWAAFFREHNFLVGISIDGPRAMHDAYRVDKGGAGTFDRVMRGLSFLKKHGVEWNALTTVHHTNAREPLTVYRFLRDACGAQYIQFIPIIERVMQGAVLPADMIPVRNADTAAPAWTTHYMARNADLAGKTIRVGKDDERFFYMQEGSQVTERSVTAQEYGNFLIGVYDEWVRHDVARVYVQMFDVALANWYGEPSGLCVFSETCGGALAMEHNGDLYSCDHFVEPKFKLGNIQQTHMAELVASEQQRKFGLDKRDTLPKYCRECDVRFACHGGCPKDRFILTPDGEAGLNYLCAGYKMFFHHIDADMRRMSELLRQDNAPADIMQWYAEQDKKKEDAFARAGRNDPCPCGSGKKFKHCHGKT